MEKLELKKGFDHTPFKEGVAKKVEDFFTENPDKDPHHKLLVKGIFFEQENRGILKLDESYLSEDEEERSKKLRRMKRASVDFLNQRFEVYDGTSTEEGEHRFEQIEHLGSGGFGDVFLVKDYKKKDIRVAKFINPESIAEMKAIKKEMLVLKKLGMADMEILVDQPFTDDPVDEMQFVILSDYIDGAELAYFENLEVLDILELVSQVCDELDRVHKEGIIHQDIHPGNIMVTHDATARLIDFGLVDYHEQENSDDDSFHGTMRALARGPKPQRPLVTSMQKNGAPAYAAPEVSLGLPGRATRDVYSLGMTLYVMLTDDVPEFNEAAVPDSLLDDTELFIERYTSRAKQKEADLSPVTLFTNNRHGIHDDIFRIVAKATSYFPEHRYQSTLEMKKDIEKVMANLAA